MNRDKAAAGLILMAVAVYGAIWYYRRKGAFQGTTVDSLIGPVSIGQKIELAGSPLEKLKSFAMIEGLKVTSTIGGGHNPGSLHYAGRAVDVRSIGMSDSAIAQLKSDAEASGIVFRDERQRPAGQAVWGGPHIHLELPF